jgi:hypothetical protein
MIGTWVSVPTNSPSMKKVKSRFPSGELEEYGMAQYTYMAEPAIGIRQPASAAFVRTH